MKSNHQLSHDQEVKKESKYEHWKIKVNNQAVEDITSKELLEFLNGDNMEITIANNKITFKSLPALFQKPNKVIDDPIYTIQAGDIFKWLVFTVDCTVTVPTGLITPMLFEGEADGCIVTFVAAIGVNLRHVASISKILSPDGVFGIRMRATDNALLYGTDPVNYLAQ